MEKSESIFIDGKMLGEILDRHNATFNAVLDCPGCGKRHIDAPEPEMCKCGHGIFDHDETLGLMCEKPMCICPAFKIAWDNPPHKKHLCHGCGNLWTPYPFNTNGVAQMPAAQTTVCADAPPASDI